VSYTRARAEGLGVECRGGLMQRAERYILLGVSSLFSTVLNHLSCRSTHFILVGGLILLAALTNLTALSRIRTVVATLEDQ
jgi:CDP-diacylglycerol--glycerol-3-phosphate 3-phosphatidyltransferase